MSEKYVVDGYSFKNEQEAIKAQNELEGIEYLKKRTNFNKPEDVLAVYNKVIEKQLFKTPLGYGFLREMQQNLQNSDGIDLEIIPDIPVILNASKKEKSARPKKVRIIPDEREVKYKNRISNVVILNVFLIIIIIVIIVLTNNSSNTNILNYKERLEREYKKKEDEFVQWNKELIDKEDKLREKEKTLNQD